MKKIAVCLVALAALLGIFSNFGTVPTHSESIYQIMSLKGSCTAFQVKGASGKNYIMTAAHCFDLAENGLVKVMHEDGRIDVTGVIYVAADSDLMLLAADALDAPISVAKSTKAGEPIYSYSHPRGDALELSKGNLDWFKVVTTSHFSFIESCGVIPGVEPGSSGGPIFNAKGEVIGVISAGNDLVQCFVTLHDIKALLAQV